MIMLFTERTPPSLGIMMIPILCHPSLFSGSDEGFNFNFMNYFATGNVRLIVVLCLQISIRYLSGQWARAQWDTQD